LNCRAGTLGFKTSTGDVKQTLFDCFGYSSFRDGQEEVVQSALAGQDSAVFWATGDGKSLCYQMPALHSNKMTIVVSPLISLMQDQVQKLNNTVGLGKKEIAIFLGSAQMDPHAESKALAGEIQVVYLTPEKLLGSFLSQLADMHNSPSSRGIGLLAIDEAHCVSQWGHDFRPEYSRMGEFRKRIPSVPIMVLTATAVQKVQKDICDSLQLRNPYKSLHTFDRPNFAISVMPSSGTMSTMLDPIAAKLLKKKESTIVYAPTTSIVAEVTSWFANRFEGSGVKVRMYHGSLPQDERQDAHMSFLNGSVHVIVATIAFGMGIDKPDIRRVVHYHAPKTVEEYYQQIGRAGRDGNPAECEMFFFTPDFVRYQSDFYLGKLSFTARAAMSQSIEAMRKYSEDISSCRRRQLLQYFDEVPKFDACNKCDCCRRSRQFAGDKERDFSAEAHLILTTVAGCANGNGVAMTVLVKASSGAAQDHYASPPPFTLDKLKQMRAALNLKPMGALPRFTRTNDFIKELVPALARSGHLDRQTKTTGSSGGGTFGQGASMSRTYEVYVLTSKGRATLNALDGGRGGEASVVRMEVPAVVRKLEAEQKEKAKQLVMELEQGGVDVGLIPAEELAAGTGDVLTAEKMWLRMIQNMRQSKPDKAVRLESLLTQITEWRDAAAQQLGMAPGSVLQPHVAKKLAYSRPTDVEALRAVGVRINGVEQLAAIISAWVKTEDSMFAAPSLCNSAPMLVPKGKTMGQKWKFAVYKERGGKNNRKPPLWEYAWGRFENDDESPSQIAMSWEGGKTVLTSTIVKHLLNSLTFGKAVSLGRIAQVCAPEQIPNEAAWMEFADAEAVSKMNVTAEDFMKQRADFCRAIVGDLILDTDYTDRTEEQKETLNALYGRLEWYIVFRRAGIKPEFARGGAGPSPTKKARAC
jgi:ATP-dependent DNA helicase RecQ/Werner syndrome ATP-dependent helicase